MQVLTVVNNAMSAGFFACCSVKLTKLIDHMNKWNKIPDHVDGTNLFQLYKPVALRNADITLHFFRDYKTESTGALPLTAQYSVQTQVRNYHNVKYADITPYIRKFFMASEEIKGIETKLTKKYGIDFAKQQYCAVYYRGLDKLYETPLGTYTMYIEKMKEIRVRVPQVIFIVQSDEKAFIDAIKAATGVGPIILFDENEVTEGNMGIHRLQTPDQNHEKIKTFFAIVLILSKCQHLVCSSGNCSMWMLLYRGHSSGVVQCLNDKWYERSTAPHQDETANNVLKYVPRAGIVPKGLTRTPAEMRFLAEGADMVKRKQRKWIPRRGTQFA